jgi:hypothetical protein
MRNIPAKLYATVQAVTSSYMAMLYTSIAVRVQVRSHSTALSQGTLVSCSNDTCGAATMMYALKSLRPRQAADQLAVRLS